MNRQHMLAQLGMVPDWDMVVIGGGATGLGVAVDAASRGYKILLVEQFDFAKGTSGNSTKLIHGGVRYMAQGNIKLVRESLKERGILLKNAPHLCHELPFIIPAFHLWEKWFYYTGLKLYNFLSGKRRLGKPRMLSKKETTELLPAINAAKLSGAVLYHDGQFDDSRLALTLALTAVDHGAAVINYCSLVSITKTHGRISAVTIRDSISNKEHHVTCKAVINATGVFTDRIMQMDNSSHQAIIKASQGAHLVVDAKFFPGNHAMLIPKTDDGRVLFAVPWNGKVLFGTTDSPVNEIKTTPVPLPEEIDYILEHINRYLTTGIGRRDVKTVFAGLRPLIDIKGKKTTSLLPRDFTTVVSSSGLITITGGKWTTYRAMGKNAVDNAVFVAKLPKKQQDTASLKLHGYRNQINKKEPLRVYGSDADAIRQMILEDPGLNKPIHPAFTYTAAEVIWAVRAEMAVTLEDVLSRRTRALILDAQSAIEAAPFVASLMAKEMNRSAEWQEEQIKEFVQIAHQYIIH